MAVDLPPSAVDRLVDILGKQAGSSAVTVDPKVHFRNLVRASHLPETWTNELAGVWVGDPYIDARSLVMWAAARDRNPADARFTTLGSVLTAALPGLGLDGRATIVAIVVTYGLYVDKELLGALEARYQVPEPASRAALGEPSATPEFNWRGPEDELELQGLFHDEPEFLDVGFLSLAIARSASVCRIEADRGRRIGTGFLVGADIVLTNNHVLEAAAVTDDATAGSLLVRFGSVTAETGREAEGQTFRLAQPGSVIERSPTNELDFALLRVEPKILEAKDVERVPYDAQRPPTKGMGLNILQHPDGQAMKVAFSSNGITGVYPDSGLLQYVTRTAGGSSGSPCFDDDWKVVALHHAERSRAFGAVREGVLLSAIHPRIEAHL
jgi:endonuclease G, mitochondrial